MEYGYKQLIGENYAFYVKLLRNSHETVVCTCYT